MASSGEDSIISKAVLALPLYVIYFFVSGWAFNDFYFRYFGIDPRFLEFGFYDTLVKGFTIAAGAPWLLFMYLALFIVPLALDRWLRSFYVKLASVLTSLIIVLIGVYLLSRSFGESRAKIDKGEHSTLPAVTFSIDKRDYVGKLVFIKGDLLFIHRARLLASEDTGSDLELSVLKVSEIKNLKIVEHQ